MNVSKQYNFSRIESELVRALRGGRSQNWVSRKLGYEFNQMHRWETGKTQIKWSEFVRLCKVLKRDLPHALLHAFGYRDVPERSGLLIQQSMGKRKIVEIAKDIGVSRFVLQDWVNGKTSPPLHKMLRLIDHFDMLFLFIDKLLGEMIPSLALDFKKKQCQLDLFYDHPICSAILVSLQLKEYMRLKTHRDGVIAASVGITKLQEREYLSRLENCGAIYISGGKYKASAEHFDARGDYSREIRMRAYWVQKGIEQALKQTQPSARGSFAFGIVAVSPDQEDRLKQALTDFVTAAMKIGREAQPSGNATSLKVICMQVFDPANC